MADSVRLHSRPEHQTARMSNIKDDGLDQYGTQCSELSPFSVSGSEENKHPCLVIIVLAIISYSIPFCRPITLQHASRLDSKTEFMEWTIFPTDGGRFFHFFHFWVDLFSVAVFS